MKRPWVQVLYLLYCVEAGVYLLLVPWSILWNRMALTWAGGQESLLLSGAARGAVSALGALVLGVGAVDLVRFCRVMRET